MSHHRLADPFVFFLGGGDLEMVTIAELVRSLRGTIHDLHLAWGAHAASYEPEIIAECQRGKLPVLVELNVTGLSLPEPCIIIDHHGQWAGKPTSLEQVFALLKLPTSAWTRQLALVAANDRGHIRGMLELEPPGTRAEIVAIRQADLAAQGVSPDQWQQAQREASETTTLCDGQLTVAHTASSRTGLVAEALEPIHGGPGFHNLLVLGDKEMAFYGAGEIILALVDQAPADTSPWYGGDLPTRGFFGCHRAELKLDPVQFVADFIAGRQ